MKTLGDINHLSRQHHSTIAVTTSSIEGVDTLLVDHRRDRVALTVVRMYEPYEASDVLERQRNERTDR